MGLYTGLLYQPTPYLEDLYKHYFGKKPETGEDLIKILNEADRLAKRYKAMFQQEKPDDEEDKGASLEEVILGVEMILDRTIDRTMKIYQFKYYYDKSLEVIRRRESAKYKQHG